MSIVWLKKIISRLIFSKILKSNEASGKGNKKLDDEVFFRLAEEITKSDKRWRGKDKQAWIEKEYGIKVSEQGIAYRMKKI